MSAEFRPPANARLHRQSPQPADQAFIIAAMFTPSMADYAERLRRSLEALNLHFVLYEVPSVHRSISSKGTDDLAFSKPNFINFVHAEYRVPVLYVDADVVFRASPELVHRLTREPIDFAAFNWLGPDANDSYAPVELAVDGIPTTDRFYGFSHSIDVCDPTQLIVSGAAQYYTPAARPLLQAWLDTISVRPAIADDELLDYAFNFGVSSNAIRAHWWTMDYCRYPWWIYTKPVIDHPQFPAGYDATRNFRAVAGHERFRKETLRKRDASGPFPRDCLIDTQERCLLRINNDGGELVGPLTTELWI